MKIISVFSLLAGIAFAFPAQAGNETFVRLATEVVAAAPEMQAASAGLDKADATARRLRAGPYEFELSGTAGNRYVETVTANDPFATGADYFEWSGGISRSVRLPGKRRMDQELAQLERDLADAGLQVARRDVQVQFAQAWNGWQAAAQQAQVSVGIANAAQEIAKMEQEKVDRGASRQVDADRLQAQAEQAGLAAAQANIQAQKTRAELVAMYPSVEFPVSPAEYVPHEAEINALLARADIVTPARKVAALSEKKAQLLARRARADRMADPTLGVEFSDEFGGKEQSVRARISIPIGGASRSAAASEAENEARIWAARLRSLDLKTQAARKSALQAARSSLQSVATAQNYVDLSQSVLERLQKAHALGAVPVTELVIARRTVQEAQLALGRERSAAASAYLNLQILLGALDAPAMDGGQF